MSALSSDKLIVELNFRDRIIDERRGRPRAFDSRRMFGLLSETVVDKRPLEMVEIQASKAVPEGWVALLTRKGSYLTSTIFQPTTQFNSQVQG